MCTDHLPHSTVSFPPSWQKNVHLYHFNGFKCWCLTSAWVQPSLARALVNWCWVSPNLNILCITVHFFIVLLTYILRQLSSLAPVARQLQCPLEACILHTPAWGELHQDGGWPDKAWAHSTAGQRHKGTCFWRLCFSWLGNQTSVPGWETWLLCLILQ